MKVPAFADIGKQAAEILYGSKKNGIFQYDTKFQVNLKTVQGVTGTMKAVKKHGGDQLSTDFKLSYAEKGLSLETQPADKKATVKYTHPVFDGLKVSLEATAPDPAKGVKGTLDYSQPYFTSKATVKVAKNPIFNVNAATGYNGWVLGASAVVDARASNLSDIEGAASYMGPDFVATAHTVPNFSVVRGTYWQQLDAASSVAAEVKHVPADNKVELAMAYCHLDTLTGTMHKVKFGNDGSVHLHRETPIRTDTSVGLSLCLNALNLSAEPKLGLCIDHSPP